MKHMIILLSRIFINLKEIHYWFQSYFLILPPNDIAFLFSLQIAVSIKGHLGKTEEFCHKGMLGAYLP